MMKSKRRFKNLLVNPGYQLKYVFWITITGLMLIITYSAVFYSYVRENYKIHVDLSPMEDNAKALLYQELNEIIMKLGLASLFCLAVVSLFGIVLSHRVAGPMFHFKRVFRAIREGNRFERIHLRPGDDFRDVADEFNQMIEGLETQVRKP